MQTIDPLVTNSKLLAPVQNMLERFEIFVDGYWVDVTGGGLPSGSGTVDPPPPPPPTPVDALLVIQDVTHAHEMTSVVFPPLPPPTYYTYYISPGGSDSAPGTILFPWKTITKANATMVAGDSVFIEAGSYSSYVAPARSGTAGNYIEYYADGSATITDTAYAINIASRNYIKVTGIKSYYTDKGLYITNGSYNIIDNCHLDTHRARTWFPNMIYLGSQYNQIRNSSISRFGYSGGVGVPSGGACLCIGGQGSVDATNYNLVEGCDFYSGGIYSVSIHGAYNVFRNNTLCHEDTVSKTFEGVMFGHRCLLICGLPASCHHNLVEGNKMARAGFSHYGTPSTNMAVQNDHNIVRKNVFYYASGTGFNIGTNTQGGPSAPWDYPGYPMYNKVYNNTIFGNGWWPNYTSYGMSFTAFGGSHDCAYNAVKNNIFYGNEHDEINYTVYPAFTGQWGPQIVANNWYGTNGNPLFVSASVTPPATDNEYPYSFALPDFHLQAASPCKTAGGALTRIVSPAGTGTSFVVDDAGYFCDGWGIIEGDIIRLIGVGAAQTAMITAVDYDSNLITVDSELTWTLNQGVMTLYVGTAPYVGAFDYIA